MKPYALFLSAPVVDRPWGGSRLAAQYGFEGYERTAEAWVVSTHPDGMCTVKNGPLAGKPLDEAWAALGQEELPVLVKLIDAAEALSVQVHPDDAYAARVEGDIGKTEMWYVVDAEPDTRILYGFDRAVDRAEFAARIADGTLLDVCNRVPASVGDAFFIEAGTLHAIGAGALIAEVQQNSNLTYRVFDYGRPRELHVDKALDVTVTAPPVHPYGNVGETVACQGGTVRPLAACGLFTVELRRAEKAMEMGADGSFAALLLLDGEAAVTADGETVHMTKGQSVLLPEGVKACVTGGTWLYTEKGRDEC